MAKLARSHAVRRALVILACAAVALTGCRSKHSVSGPAVQMVVPSEAFVELGHRMQFTLTPFDLTTTWRLPDGPSGGFISRRGNYYAPLALTAPSPVRIEGQGGLGSSFATVYLVRTPPLESDCLGTGQSADALRTGYYTYLDELPEALVRAYPTYPDSAREAGIQGTVVVQALVCACGGIERVEMASSIPGLDGAAMDAVRQWLFSPGLVNGEPQAVWVAIPVKFTLHAPADGPQAGAPEVSLGTPIVSARTPRASSSSVRPGPDAASTPPAASPRSAA